MIHDPYSGHVVPRDAAVIRQVEDGKMCARCHRPYRVHLWPHDQMIVECRCLCACHADRRPKGLMVAG